jgi:hypothetical protein
MPSASNFRAVSTDDNDEYEALLLGHGWAALFGRRYDGSVAEFTGWQGYSTSTSTQMGKARRVITEILPDSEFEQLDRQPKYNANSLNWRVQQSGAEEL